MNTSSKQAYADKGHPPYTHPLLGPIMPKRVDYPSLDFVKLLSGAEGQWQTEIPCAVARVGDG